MRHSRFHTTVISSRPRQGQALLLAVLLMVFIALLGTTFISIVASNMGNTARSGAKDEARQAANTGIQFADSQLSGSTAGLDWRPNQAAITGDYYYSAFDRVQGWSQAFFHTVMATSNNPDPAAAKFVKYPNPDGSAVSSAHNNSNFMLRVSQVDFGDADNADNSKTGDIRIESIGFASDDPTAYYRAVAYKKGPANTPLTAAMRSISNWDWDSNDVPQAIVDNNGASDTANLHVMNLKGSFNKNDNVTIWDPTLNQVGSSVVQSVTSGGGSTVIVLAPDLGFTPSAGSIIQRASVLGIPDGLSVNYDNENATPVNFRISGLDNFAGASISNTPGSVWVNGGLVWSGNDFLTNLVSANVAANTKNFASNIQVSGVYTKTAGANVQASGSGVGAVTAIPDSSVDPNFGSNPVVTNNLINDGANRLLGALDPSRQVQDFTPPDITSGGDGFGRYRQLTQYSQSTVSGAPQAAAYGYGQGIYINNPQDVEKVANKDMTQAQLHDLWFTPGNPPTNNSVTQTSFERLQVPADAASSDYSLEQQHLRGWISPDQFLPRGAEVVLNNTTPPTLTITLDGRSDNDADSTNGYENLYATQTIKANPITAKMWRAADGSIETGVYTKTQIPWPANGTIFAEGNIRIRGKVANAPRSLTVVSMNNIYIEGSLKIDNSALPADQQPKVLLLAKNNVVVNPTQALETPEVFTMLRADYNTSDGKVIQVADAAGFQPGDYISINGSVQRYVVAVDVPANTLTVDTNLSSTYTAGSAVHTIFDPSMVNAQRGTAAIRIQKFTQGVERRVTLYNGDPTNIRLAFRHSAEYKKALTVQIDPTLMGDKPDGMRIDSMELNNKAIDDNKAPVITAKDKYLRIDYGETPINHDGDPGTSQTGTDTFADLGSSPYQTNISDSTDVTAADNISMGDLYKQILDKHADTSAKPHWDYGNAVGSPPVVVGTSVQNNLTYTGPATTTSGNRWVNIDDIDNTSDPNAYHTKNASYPRFYFMASVGNRKDFGATDPASYPINQQVYPNVDPPFVVPMGTSVWMLVNGVQATLQGNVWDNGIDDFYKVLQFGFAPLFVNRNSDGDAIISDVNTLTGITGYSGAQAYADNEDALTSDQYFYQPYGKENITSTYGGEYGGTTYNVQTKYDTDSKYTLDSRRISDPNLHVGTNTLVLQLNDAQIGGHPLNYYYQNNYQIPFYRLSNLKLQRESLDEDNSPHNLNGIEVGTKFDIDAYVYAQEGSWNVIPGPYFDNDVKNGSTIAQDLNRDGVISQGESAAAYRFHRYNYQIVFTGAISENQTASMDQVKDWVDKWATVKLTDANFSGGSVVPDSSLTYNSADPANSNFNTILYYYDPTAASGVLNADTDGGFHVPVASGGLIYQE